MLRSYRYAVFIGARCFALVLRPGTIALLLHLHRKDVATAYALALTAIQMGALALKNEVYQNAYRAILAPEPRTGAIYRELVTYFRHILAHVLMALPVLFLIPVLMGADPQLAAFVVFAVLAEKTYDETQRFYIYSKGYLAWSVLTIGRNLIPLLVLLGAALAEWRGLIGPLTAVACWLTVHTLSAPLIAWFQIGRTPKSAFAKAVRGFRLASVRQYVGFLTRGHGLVVIYALFGASVLYLDRSVVARTSPHELAAYVLAATLTATTIISHDFFYLTPRRSSFVHPTAHPFRHMLNWRNALSAITPGAIILTGILLFGKSFSGGEVDYRVALALSISFSLYNLTSPAAQYSFWNAKIWKLIVAEALAVCVGAAALFVIGPKPAWHVPVAMICLVVARLMAYTTILLRQKGTAPLAHPAPQGAAQ